MKKILFSFLIILFFFTGCDKKAVENPYSTPVSLPKAVVEIEVDIDSISGGYDFIKDSWYLTFQIIFTETAGVQVSLTEVKVQFYDGSVLLYQDIGSGGTLPAGGTLSVIWIGYFTELEILTLPDMLDRIVISARGTDANGHSIFVSESYSGGTLTALKNTIKR